MTTFREYRMKAKLSGTRLAELAGVDRRTVRRANRGQPIQGAIAGKLLEVLNAHLGVPLDFKDIEDLKLL